MTQSSSEFVKKLTNKFVNLSSLLTNSEFAATKGKRLVHVDPKQVACKLDELADGLKRK
jgi:hypothetical protein